MSHLTSRNTAVGVNDLKIHPKLPIKLTEDMKNRTVPKQELRTPPWLHFIGGGYFTSNFVNCLDKAWVVWLVRYSCVPWKL